MELIVFKNLEKEGILHMKKQWRLGSLLLVLFMMLQFLTACSSDTSSTPESKEQSNGVNEKYEALVNVDYDAIIDSLPELTEEEKDRVVEMGFRDCDHMVAACIGEAAGIYENLGMKVNVTKTGKVYEAMAAGKMDCAYMGFGGLVKAAYKGAPICVAAGNHTGGSWYLVVSNDIEKPEDLIGKKMAIGSNAETSTSWNEVAEDAGIPVEIDNYEVFDMKDKDEYFAFKAGQLDGFTCCDPWGSYAEYEGTGKIMATGWGAASGNTSGPDAGIHCSYSFNTNFTDQYPNLATRLMYAHILSVQYMYQHPYRSGEIFAEYFDVPLEVGLRTIWVKMLEEGRTITWDLVEENFEVYMNEYERFNIPQEDRAPLELDNLEKVWNKEPMENAMACGAPDFETFISEKVDPVLPVGMSYEEFLAVAKEIDGITD